MWLLAAGILALVLAGAGVALAALRGWRLKRAVGRLNGELAPTLDRISAANAQIQVQLERAEGARGRLEGRAAQLQRSRAVLDLQLDAIHGAVASVRRVLWFVPGM
jgi:hypothetical protein